MKRHFLPASLLAAVAVVIVMLWHEVPVGATEAEQRFLAGRLQAADVVLETAVPENFADQIAAIQRIQAFVLEAAPAMTPIPAGHSREPEALFAARGGHCADRSRAIEKILRMAGFTVRHVFLLARKDGENYWRPLFAANRDSHAVTEVLTEKGWLIVDSNDRWLTIDKDGRPVSAAQLERQAYNNALWQNPAPNEIYFTRVTAIYRLYARHGRFYPPYNALPDMNLGELAQNFFD